MIAKSCFFRLLPIALLLVISSMFAWSQTAPRSRKPGAKDSPPSTFKLVSIQVTGANRFAVQDIIVETGLQIGRSASEADFQQASQRLGASGAFSDISYKYEYAPAGTKLEFQVKEKDADEYVPARFDNLVWFSDQELREKLREGAPLFHGELPLTGSMPDQVLEILQALLAEKKVPGRLDYLRLSKQDGPVTAIVFTVTGPHVRIRNVDFTGASAEVQLPLRAAAKEIQGQEYLRSFLEVQASKVLLPVFLQRGFLKAAFADAQAKIVHADPENQDVLVDVTFPVVPGLQYKFTGVRWLGNTIFPAEELLPLIQLRTGQPVNAVQLDTDLETVRNLYGSHGYVLAHIAAVPHMDDAASTVRYELQVQEGDLYRMGELEIQGLDSQIRARLIEAWQLRAGEPYDASYLKRFLEGANKIVTANSKASVLEAPDQHDKTVDVTVRFDTR